MVTLQSPTGWAGERCGPALRVPERLLPDGLLESHRRRDPQHGRIDISAWKKLDEVPYDFLRKRLSIPAAGPEGTIIVTKGALAQVLEVCTTAENGAGIVVPLTTVREQIDTRFATLRAGVPGSLPALHCCEILNGVSRACAEES
jgi:magnesium-transporting ATPase (P-type)